MNLQKVNEKKIFNRLRYAKITIISICIDVYRSNDGSDFEKSTVCLTRFEKRKLKSKIELVDLYKSKNPNFEQNHSSRTAKCN